MSAAKSKLPLELVFRDAPTICQSSIEEGSPKSPETNRLKMGEKLESVLGADEGRPFEEGVSRLLRGKAAQSRERRCEDGIL